MREQHRLMKETDTKVADNRLAELQAEYEKLLSRVLEAEAEAEKRRYLSSCTELKSHTQSVILYDSDQEQTVLFRFGEEKPWQRITPWGCRPLERPRHSFFREYILLIVRRTRGVWELYALTVLS